MKKQIVSPYVCLADLRHEKEAEAALGKLSDACISALQSEGVKLENRVFERTEDPVDNPCGGLARVILDCEIPDDKAVREQTGIKISCFAQVHLYDGGMQGKLICNLNPLAFDWVLAFDRDKTSVQPTIIDVPGLEDYVRPKVAEPVLEQRPSLPQVKEEAIV